MRPATEETSNFVALVAVGVLTRCNISTLQTLRMKSAVVAAHKTSGRNSAKMESERVMTHQRVLSGGAGLEFFHA
jgi:hypothetical protein